jgi:hypothetical protein
MTRQLQALLSQLEGSGVLASGHVGVMMDQLQQRMRPFRRGQLAENADCQWLQTDYVCLQRAVAGGQVRRVVSTLQELLLLL